MTRFKVGDRVRPSSVTRWTAEAMGWLGVVTFVTEDGYLSVAWTPKLNQSPNWQYPSSSFELVDNGLDVMLKVAFGG